MKLLIAFVISFLCLTTNAQEVWFKYGSKVPTPKLVIDEVLQFNEKQANYNQLSHQEKEVYYYTNVARSNPTYFWDSVVSPILSAFPHLKGKYSKSLKIDLDKTANLPLLKLQSKLISTAKYHVNDMASAEGDYFSHTSTNGKTFVDRMQAASINAYTAENIAMGQQTILLSVVLLFLDIDVPNLGHRVTLLNPTYTQIGIGVSYKTKEQFYIVQDFSSEFY